MLEHRSFKALCALACALALAGFAGCGGDDDDEKSAGGTATEETTGGASSGGGDDAEYKQAFQAAGEDFRNAAQAAAGKVQSATDTAGRVQALEGLKTVVGDAADDFEALDPPADVKADHDKLVSQFRGVATEVDAVRTALKTDDQAAAQAAAQGLQGAQAEITETLGRIEAKVGG
ncbi:MAG: hypothetical protein M3356_06225 [Actinomycetota bacterium]|nr:hypothetical protein [Actinomycetota bacterium]